MHLTEREWNEKKAEIAITLAEEHSKEYLARCASVNSVAEIFMKNLGYTKEEPKP